MLPSWSQLGNLQKFVRGIFKLASSESSPTKRHTIIPAFADKSEGPHAQKTQIFDQHFGPKNVKKHVKSS